MVDRWNRINQNHSQKDFTHCKLERGYKKFTNFVSNSNECKKNKREADKLNLHKLVQMVRAW